MKKRKMPTDPNELAVLVVKLATSDEDPDESHAQKLGRKGGLKGGKARAKKLSKAQRKKIASKAAKARWANNK